MIGWEGRYQRLHAVVAIALVIAFLLGVAFELPPPYELIVFVTLAAVVVAFAIWDLLDVVRRGRAMLQRARNGETDVEPLE